MVADAPIFKPFFEPVTAEALSADPARALRLAELAWSAQPEFYALIAMPREAILDSIARQIADPAFDMPQAFVLRGGEDVALVTSIDLSSLAKAQMAALMAFLRSAPKDGAKEVQIRMRAYAASIEPIDDAGRYVSRVAVADERRGEGLGRQAMSEYLRRAGASSVHLHVHRGNAPAIALYRSLGFVRRSDADFIFPAFTRPAI